MKRIVVCLLLSASAAFGTPMDRQDVPASARWILHLDVDALRETAFGKYVFEQVLDKKFADTKKAFPALGVLLDRLQSATAFGEDTSGKDKNGVMLLKTDADSEKQLETLLKAGMAGVTKGYNVEQLTSANGEMYIVNKDLFVQPLHNGRILVSKARPELESAREVLQHKGESLANSKAFTGFGDGEGHPFLFGAVEGLSESAKAFPQAKLLQLSEGGSVSVGERNDQLKFDLALRAKDEETSNQMQQVVQGLIALVSLTQSQNKDVASFLNSAKVNQKNHVLHVNLSFPVAEAIHRVEEKQRP